METQKFQGIEKSSLLLIRDEELKEVLFAPSYKEFIKIGAIAFAILLLFSLIPSGMPSTITNYSGADYSLCTSTAYNKMKEGSRSRELCDSLLLEAKSNGISTREGYVTLKISQYENDPFSVSNILRIAGAAILALAVILAAMKKADPFFMTKIAPSLEIAYAGTALNSFKIADKTIKKGILKLNGVMIRKFESGYCIVTFYYMEGNSKEAEPVPSAERVVFGIKDAEKIADRLNGFVNLKAGATAYNEMLIAFK